MFRGDRGECREEEELGRGSDWCDEMEGMDPCLVPSELPALVFRNGANTKF